MFSQYIENVGQFATIRQAEKARFKRLDIQQTVLIRVLQGKKTVYLNDQAFEAGQREAVFIASGQVLDIVNDYSDDGLYEAEILIFDGDLISTARRAGKLSQMQQRVDVKSIPVGKAMSLALEAARDAILSPDTLPKAVLQHRFEEILVWLSAYGISFPDNLKRDLLYDIRTRIDANISRDWKTADMARDLGFSEATFRRRLQAHGQTFSHMVTEARMMQALFLLQSSDLSILDIADAVGYASPSKFASRFKARFDLNPSQIRSRDFDRIGTINDRQGRELTV